MARTVAQSAIKSNGIGVMMLDVDRLNELRLRFDQDGYVVVPDLVPHEKLDQMRTMVDAVLEGKLSPESPNSRGAVDDWDIQWEPRLANNPAVDRSKKVRVVFHMAHCHRFFWSHATRPEILSIVSALSGPDVDFYTDQMFVKPARHGSEVPFHQDSGYWPSVEPRMLSCWFALDDATIENGCVHVIPGTHKRAIPHSEFDHPTQPLGLHPHEVDVSRERPVEIQAGGAMFHHSLLVHRSFPNTSDKGRRGLVTIYMPADIRFFKPWHFHFGFKPILRDGLPV